jgi:phosphate transport system permease protein
MRLDRWAGRIVALGGCGVIGSILAILVFVAAEVRPLFRPARVTRAAEYPAAAVLDDRAEGERIVMIGLDENREVGYLVTRGGTVAFFDPRDGSPRGRFSVGAPGGGPITAARRSLDGRRLALGTAAGGVLLHEIDFHPLFREGTRSYAPEINLIGAVDLDPAGRRSVVAVAQAGDAGERSGVAVILDDGRVVVRIERREESLFGDGEVSTARYELGPGGAGDPTAVALDGRVRNLYVGTTGGKILHWSIPEEGPPAFTGAVNASVKDGAAVTVLDFLIGDRTLLAGDASGGIGAFNLVRDSTSVEGYRLMRIHGMAAHPAAISAFAPSARGKSFISADVEGGLRLQHTTSERCLAAFRHAPGAGVHSVCFAPKADGALTVGSEGRLVLWEVDSPHPEAGFSAFFGRIWYEGYEEPGYVWQSSGGSDEFEPKFSLVPLLFGTFKGTFYALVLSVPLAILAALYTSQFLHGAARNFVKPTVEIMAALPSVVLGFLAGLWLAPRIERVVPGVFLMLLLVPALLLVASGAWQAVPLRIRGRFRPGIEAAIALPLIVLGIALSFTLSGVVEAYLFEGDFSRWIYEHLLWRYDQRNALVVGFAMGFAVVPIIYTIAEDALSNVPRHLVSGSLALGATRWQTAVRVVLPTAAAGIFSAVMIGFGRAVGETMIVLMATGNTPIMDWNLFNGFRTLSANIAVEIPEAPVGGTLYRLLFMAAFLLFVITFLVNTAAELVRQRLRNRYQRL